MLVINNTCYGVQSYFSFVLIFLFKKDIFFTSFPTISTEFYRILSSKDIIIICFTLKIAFFKIDCFMLH